MWIPAVATAIVVLGTLAAAPRAAAQPPDPIGPIVVDVRGPFARFKQDGSTAQVLGVNPDNLPTRGLGLAVGAHWYPFRRPGLNLGLGGELLWARDSKTVEPASATATPGPTVSTKMSTIAPHVSLNFGNGDGWSYVSGGIGLASLAYEREDQPFTDDAPRVRMTHYGGGARWFARPHLAFTFDLRFYSINAQEAVGTRPAFPRQRMMVISAGISLR